MQCSIDYDNSSNSASKGWHWLGASVSCIGNSNRYDVWKEMDNDSGVGIVWFCVEHPEIDNGNKFLLQPCVCVCVF